MSSNHLRHRAYEYLRRRIVSGSLAPGKQVSELSLAKELGVSRTPMREAIRQLVSEGLVEQVPRFGTIVCTLSRRDLLELYELREAMESYAVGAAAERINAADLAALARMCDQIGILANRMKKEGTTVLQGAMLKRFLAADMGFHMLLLRAAGNQRMMKMVADTRLLTSIFGTRWQQHTVEGVEDTYRAHSRILRAVKQKDAEKARHLIAEHIHKSRNDAVQQYDGSHAQSAAASPITLGMPEDLIEELNEIERASTVAVEEEKLVPKVGA